MKKTFIVLMVIAMLCTSFAFVSAGAKPATPNGVSVKYQRMDGNKCVYLAKWGHASRATSYICSMNGKETQVGTLNKVYKLERHKTYVFKVRSKNKSGKSGWSKAIRFTTK